MDLIRFLDEFYQGQSQGVLNDYVNDNWDEALEIFGDNPAIFDGLIELSIKHTKADYDAEVERLIVIANTTKDFANFDFKFKSETELLRKENAELKRRQEMTEEALLMLSDMMLGGV